VALAAGFAGAFTHRLLVFDDLLPVLNDMIVLHLAAASVSGLLGWYLQPRLHRRRQEPVGAVASPRCSTLLLWGLWAATALFVAAIPITPRLSFLHADAMPENGPYAVKWVSGEQAEEGEKLDGKQHGLWIEYYRSGAKRSEGHYDHGQENGLWTWWDEKGQPFRTVTFDHGVEDGPASQWHTAEVKATERHLSNGVEDGAYREWFSPGHLRQTGSQRRGKRHGSWTVWHDGCQPACENADEAKAITVTYDDGSQMTSGRLQQDYSLRDAGEYPMASRGAYRDGERVGSWTFWHENGVKASEGGFVDDKPHGGWTYWDTAGSVVAVVTWEYAAQDSCEVADGTEKLLASPCCPHWEPLPRCLEPVDLSLLPDR
jgi:antitoxin component YwqK of YwqJK toxin-antitoxin module